MWKIIQTGPHTGTKTTILFFDTKKKAVVAWKTCLAHKDGFGYTLINDIEDEDGKCNWVAMKKDKTDQCLALAKFQNWVDAVEFKNDRPDVILRLLVVCPACGHKGPLLPDKDVHLCCEECGAVVPTEHCPYCGSSELKYGEPNLASGEICTCLECSCMWVVPGKKPQGDKFTSIVTDGEDITHFSQEEIKTLLQKLGDKPLPKELAQSQIKAKYLFSADLHPGSWKELAEEYLKNLGDETVKDSEVKPLHMLNTCAEDWHVLVTLMDLTMPSEELDSNCYLLRMKDGCWLAKLDGKPAITNNLFLACRFSEQVSLAYSTHVDEFGEFEGASDVMEGVLLHHDSYKLMSVTGFFHDTSSSVSDPMPVPSEAYLEAVASAFSFGKKPPRDELQEMFDGYMEAMLAWFNHLNVGEPFTAKDVEPKTEMRMLEDCTQLYESHCGFIAMSSYADNFWFAGACFWNDRGQIESDCAFLKVAAWDAEIRKALHDAAVAFGGQALVTNDQGKIEILL